MTPIVQVQRVRKSFAQGEVLRGIDFELPEGKVMCVIGPSGSGKSTLLRCINWLEQPDSGRIYVGGDLMGYRAEGNRLYELPPRRIVQQRSQIGMVFQGFNLFAHMTAIENVAFAPIQVQRRSSREVRDEARQLLDEVGLGHRRDAYPLQLSGGEQQRVAIARARAMKPRLILFDEPTSALDPELVGDVLRAMRDLAERGITMIVVTHEIGFARDVADTVAFMDRGEIVEAGPPQDVFGNSRSDRTRAFLSHVR